MLKEVRETITFKCHTMPMMGRMCSMLFLNA